MDMHMERYYYALVSHTGRLLTNQMIWWSMMEDLHEGSRKWVT
jgi:hypothetical protein